MAARSPSFASRLARLGGKIVRPGTIGAALIAAACGSVPRPFEGVDRNQPMIEAILINPGLMVAPVTGAPPPLNQTLAEDVAASLQALDIAAVTRGAARSISLLQGAADTYRAADGSIRIRIDWTLRGPDGLTIDEFRSDVPAFADTAEDPWLVFANSDLSPAIDEASRFVAAHLMRTSAAADLPAERPELPELGTYHVTVAPMTGAPGDGATALAEAMRAVLRHPDMPVSLVVEEAASGRTFTVSGTVTLKPTGEPFDIVSLIWEVRTPEGDLLGNVAQENAVPRGSLDSRWGDNAIYAAEAAAGGILTLIVQVDPGGPPTTP